MRVRKWLTLLVALAMTLSLLVVPALAENPVAGSGSLAGKTATFTITENPAERFMMGSDVVAKFHIKVASSDTTPIRAFSFNLNATGLELATQKQAANGTFYFMPMNADTMLKPSGPYTVYDYTPGDDARNYFAAGGSDDGQGITTETEVLMIMAKVTGTGDHKLEIITDAGDKQVVAGQSLGSTTEQFSRQVNNCTIAVTNATVSGTVLDGKNGNAALSGATVKLMQGSTEKGSATTDGSGNYTFSDVAPGSYTVTVSKGDLTGSATVDVLGQNKVAPDITAMDYQKGDVNKDHLINSDDVTALLRHVSHIELLSDDAAALGDVDGNSTVNSDDVTKLLRFVSHIISSLD